MKGRQSKTFEGFNALMDSHFLSIHVDLWAFPIYVHVYIYIYI